MFNINGTHVSVQAYKKDAGYGEGVDGKVNLTLSSNSVYSYIYMTTEEAKQLAGAILANVELLENENVSE